MEADTGHRQRVCLHSQKSENSSQFDKFLLSGHVDPGEDDFTTALRETREEAGYSEDDLKIHRNISKSLSYKAKYNGVAEPKIVTYWLAELTSGRDPTLSDEHTEFRFVRKNEISSISNYPDFLEMVDFFHGEIKKLHQL